MKNDRREMDDMTQLLEIINAKGDEGELHEIVFSDELFWKSLRAQAEDSAKGGSRWNCCGRSEWLKLGRSFR
ncbi:hypothetical protein [Geobacillus sp. JS12]|uniref:hypothetical protein n=1 Tax=Geobacillus sp. JS12 TaxID=1813182 RepID=UPI001F2D2D1E|nr:hypothetical protein [Geobacillus sp. JS12]